MKNWIAKMLFFLIFFQRIIIAQMSLPEIQKLVFHVIQGYPLRCKNTFSSRIRALGSENFKIFERLYLEEKNQEYTILYSVINQGDIDMLSVLIELGIDVNQIVNQATKDRALHMAAKCGRFDMVSRLVAAGAKTCHLNKYNQTAQSLCSGFAHDTCRKISNFLIENANS